MKVAAAIVLILALGPTGCGTTARPGAIEPRREPSRFHNRLLGITARVPAGWSASQARLGNGNLRAELVATSFRIPRKPAGEVPIGPTSICRSNGSTPPPGGVAVVLYEHPSFDGSKVTQLKSWFPARPSHFDLGTPGNEEGYYGFNLFFQDRRRALQAQVCLHRGSRFGERRRRQTERFLDSLGFSAPRPDPVGTG